MKNLKIATTNCKVAEKWFDEYVKKQNIRNEKIKKMMSNTDYIKWIEKYTENNKSFSDMLISYSCETDKENIDNISLFYAGIKKYATENHIYPIESEYGNCYRISFNGIGYEIGEITMQGSSYICKRLDNNENCIDFNDILNNKKQDNVDYINEYLDKISKLIIKAHMNGIPKEAIFKMLESTRDNLQDKPKEYVK